jgi:hypothetical protein
MDKGKKIGMNQSPRGRSLLSGKRRKLATHGFSSSSDGSVPQLGDSSSGYDRLCCASLRRMVGQDCRTRSSAPRPTVVIATGSAATVRQQARCNLLVESKHSAVKLLRQIPAIGPIRAALLVALLQPPEPFSQQATALGLG